jgi:hypothetical protein
MKMHGLRVLRATKTRGRVTNMTSGVGLVTWSLTRRGPNGEQMLYVSPKCRRWRMEIENYVREEERLNKNPSELPRPKGDHLMDAHRYVEMGIAHLWDRPKQMLGRKFAIKMAAR